MPSASLDHLHVEACWTGRELKTLIVPVWQQKTGEGDDAKPSPLMDGPLAFLNNQVSLDLAKLADEEGFKAAKGSTLLLRLQPTDDLKAERVILLGLGCPKKFNYAAIAPTYAGAFKAALKLHEDFHHWGVTLPAEYQHNGGSLLNDEENPQTVCLGKLTDGVVNGLYQAAYASAEAKKEGKTASAITLINPDEEAVEAALPKAQALAKGQALTKDLVNTPANIKTTQTVVDAAKAIADAFPSVSLDLKDDASWVKEEMPCFYEVAKGSVVSDPPKFLHLTYKGSNPSRTLALVGKSVIFDTGGYQVKPGNYMVTMKGDMTGGASVLGALKAIAEIAPADLELHVFLAATPNRIDADAMVPDSIVDTTCGKKVEIRHTDAEGRLTLIDAVTKAADVKPEVIITVATLTGAAMRAVGRTIALLGNNSQWESKVLAAAVANGEPVQPLKVEPVDFESIESKLDAADIRNTSKSDNRGAQSAAAFVMSGAPDDQAMVHLDIAGADMMADETATGYSVRTLVDSVLTA